MPIPQVSSVVVTVRDPAGALLNGVNLQLQRPNKRHKTAGNPVPTVAGQATLSTNRNGLWQIAIVDNDFVSNVSPIYSFGGANVVNETIIRIPVLNAAFETDKDPEVDLAFVHDVLAAAQEVFSNIRENTAPTSQTDVDNLRVKIRNLVFSQLTRTGDPIPFAFDGAAHEDVSGESNSSLAKQDDSTAKQEDSTAEQDDSTATQDDQMLLADELLQDFSFTCVQCRNYYYTVGSPYYMNYTWYTSCLNSPCT